MTDEKIRLDISLVKLNIVPSRNKASGLINKGYITVNGKVINTPSFLVSNDDKIISTFDDMDFVSRGGHKLRYALEYFNLSVFDSVCLDIGASTGGFTDCLLQYGAKKIYAVDVGTNQLNKSLLENDKVISIEQTHIKSIEQSTLNGDLIDFICADLSFISLTLVSDKIYSLLKDSGQCVLLIKPQFEAGMLGIKHFKNGVIKDKEIHLKVIKNVAKAFLEKGFSVIDICPSPIKGQEGNTEFLLFIKKALDESNIDLNNLSMNSILTKGKRD